MQIQGLGQSQNFGMIRIPSVFRQTKQVNNVVSGYLFSSPNLPIGISMERENDVYKLVQYIFTEFGSFDENWLMARLSQNGKGIQSMPRLPRGISITYLLNSMPEPKPKVLRYC